MTLLIRQSPLPGPVEYSIDGATEAAEIDACTSSTLRLYGDPATLEDIVGKPLTEAQIIERREMWARGQRPETVPRAQIARDMMAHATIFSLIFMSVGAALSYTTAFAA